jgi:20S proteasome alpha/beta subunit
LLRLKYKRPLNRRVTYILGSRCKDGVVLVADTKITVDEGARYEYDDKLIGEMKELLSVIIGFSGNKEPFTEFRMRLRQRAPEIEKEAREKKTISIDKINLIISEIMKSLEGRYHRMTYDIMTGISAKQSILTYFYQDGSLEDVKTYKAIGNWTCGSIFVKENWDKDMDMETVAGIGYFVIRYIEKFQLDLGIGTGGNKPHPEIRFLPDNGHGYEANIQQIREYESDVQRNLDRLNSQFRLDFC